LLIKKIEKEVMDEALARVEELRNAYKTVVRIVAKSKQSSELWQSVKILTVCTQHLHVRCVEINGNMCGRIETKILRMSVFAAH